MALQKRRSLGNTVHTCITYWCFIAVLLNTKKMKYQIKAMRTTAPKQAYMLKLERAYKCLHLRFGSCAMGLYL